MPEMTDDEFRALQISVFWSKRMVIAPELEQQILKAFRAIRLDENRACARIVHDESRAIHQMNAAREAGQIEGKSVSVNEAARLDSITSTIRARITDQKSETENEN